MENFSVNSSDMTWQMRSMIASRWAESDPEGLKTFIATQPQNIRWGLNGALYSAWAKEDLNAAISNAQQLPINERRNAIRINSNIDSGRLTLGRPTTIGRLQRDRSLGAVGLDQALFAKWAENDPATALNTAQSLESSAARTAAITGAMQDLIQSDPQAAIEWIDSQEPTGTFAKIRQQLLNTILESDPDAVINYISAQEDPLKRNNMLRNIHFGNLVWQKDYEELEGLIEWVGEMTTGQTYSNKVGILLGAMAQSDSERAKAYALEMKPGQARMEAIGHVAQSLAQAEGPEAAIEFALGLNNLPRREAPRSSTHELAPRPRSPRYHEGSHAQFSGPGSSSAARKLALTTIG